MSSSEATTTTTTTATITTCHICQLPPAISCDRCLAQFCSEEHLRILHDRTTGLLIFQSTLFVKVIPATFGNPVNNTINSIENPCKNTNN
jgi:hypothetical protein